MFTLTGLPANLEAAIHLAPALRNSANQSLRGDKTYFVSNSNSSESFVVVRFVCIEALLNSDIHGEQRAQSCGNSRWRGTGVPAW